MIVLYKLNWSHFVEKVILALDYKGLPWRGVELNPFTKHEIRQFPRPHYVPMIEDQRTGKVLADSSPILRYLDDAYPDTPLLFPGKPRQREEIYRWLLGLDSYLGLPARRIGYAHMLVEEPSLVAELFVPDKGRGLLHRPWARALASRVVSMLLTVRFGLHNNQRDQVIQRLELFLQQLAAKLGDQPYLFGETLTAADLTLAALMRPLRVSPYFADNHAFAPLFGLQQRIFHLLGRPQYRYELAIEAARLRRGCLSTAIHRDFADPAPEFAFPLDLTKSTEDQQHIGPWQFLLAPYCYYRLRTSQRHLLQYP